MDQTIDDIANHLDTGARPRQRAPRRGTASMLAMLYLMLFSIVALGFYAAVSTSAAVSRNESAADRARAAADSGLAFARYHLATTQFDHAEPMGRDQMMSKLYDRLKPLDTTTQNFTAPETNLVMGKTEVTTAGVLGGDAYTVNPNPASVTISGATVAGTSDATTIRDNHVHTGVAPPEFPAVDTSIFAGYVTTTIPKETLPGSFPAVLENVRIASRKNVTPITLSNKTIRGVLLIEPETRILFNGNTTLAGVIVGVNHPAGDVTTNTLQFEGNVDLKGVEAIDDAAPYADLKARGGSLLLVPGFAVTFKGAAGVAGGTMAAGQFTFEGNSNLALEGSVIGLEDRPLSVGGSGRITIKPSTWGQMPSGLTFDQYTKGFRPQFPTYTEVRP